MCTPTEEGKTATPRLIDGLTPEQFLSERFRADNCMSCGRGASGHTATTDAYGDPIVRCDADDEEDPLVMRAYHRRRLFGDLR